MEKLPWGLMNDAGVSKTRTLGSIVSPLVAPSMLVAPVFWDSKVLTSILKSAQNGMKHPERHKTLRSPKTIWMKKVANKWELCEMHRFPVSRGGGSTATQTE